MAKFFSNRTASEWKAVLEAFGIKRIHDNDGDDEAWGNEKVKGLVIFVPSRDKETIIIPTAMDMVRKIEKLGLGIKRKDLLEWWKINGFGE